MINIVLPRCLVRFACYRSIARASRRSLSHQACVKPLYLINPSIFSHSAHVVTKGTLTLANRQIYWVRLNETIFHPQGGGQPSDQGTINGLPVIKVIKEPIHNIDAAFEINHCFDTPIPFEKGQEVRLQVNEEVRHKNTRLHTAGHALASVVEKLFPNLKAVNGHHFPNEARVVFEGNSFPEAKMLKERIQQEMEKLIRQRTQSVITYSDDKKRMHTIEGFPSMGCGGTHLSHLGEIGDFAIRDIKIVKKKLQIGYE